MYVFMAIYYTGLYTYIHIYVLNKNLFSYRKDYGGSYAPTPPPLCNKTKVNDKMMVR